MEDHENDGDFSTADWIAAKIECYSLGAEYEEQIFPKVKEIEELCIKLGIPFYFRAFFEQTESGNSSSTVSWLGGVGRATPEILGLTLLQQFSHDTPQDIAGLLMAAYQKFSGEEPSGIIMPL